MYQGLAGSTTLTMTAKTRYLSGQNATEFNAGTCAMNVQILLQAREQLRRDLDAGIAQLDRGEGLDEDEVFEVLDRRIGEIERAKTDSSVKSEKAVEEYPR